MKWEFNVEKANQVLEQAGWKKGADGIRAKDGKRLKIVYQTLHQRAAPEDPGHREAGRAPRPGSRSRSSRSSASVFFGSDPANWDTFPHFKADIQMYTTTMVHPDPQRFMNQFLTEEIASKANKWSGRNADALEQRGVRPDLQGGRARDGPGEAGGDVHQDERPAHPERRGDPGAVAGRAWRPSRNKIRNTEQSPWESDFWNHATWYREA